MNIAKKPYTAAHLAIFLGNDLGEWSRQHNEDILNLRSITISEKKIFCRPHDDYLFNTIAFLDLSESHLKNVEFDNIHFEYSSFEKASLTNVQFNNCTFKETSFNKSKLVKTTFPRSSLVNSTDFIKSELLLCQLLSNIQDVNFDEASFNNSTIDSSIITVSFRKSIFDSTTITIQENYTDCGSDFTEAQFLGCTLKNCKMLQSTFIRTNFSDTNINTSSFNDIAFQRANFQDITIDHETTFKQSNFRAAAIEKYSLECISENQIPIHSRVTMTIVDDIEKLRLLYSGFYQYLNTFLLCLFALPYIWFIYRQYIIAKFTPINPETTITMLGALCRFIVSGGTSWQIGWKIEWIPTLAFTVAFSYNLIRLVLLMKTLNLEHEKKIKGLPIKFSLNQNRWGIVFKVSKYLFVVNLIAVIVHTMHFLSQRVPVGIG